VVSDRVFDDDPLRLLRAVRFEDELGFRLDAEGEALVRAKAGLVTKAAGERILEELRVLSPAGYERAAELGLLEPLGGRSTRGCARSTRSGSASRSRSART
jgi:tRNA nucleotidyltransferase/poly(A) polymerase